MQEPSNLPQSPVEVINRHGRGKIIIVCEHASNNIPAHLDGLGLSEAEKLSHAAWDPGAFALAENLSQRIDAPLLAAGWSRLVYDCNRPPDSPTAIVASTDGLEIPGNRDLSKADCTNRAEFAYWPFKSALVELLKLQQDAGIKPVLVTVHSFTPVFNSIRRSVELGILHDTDTRLADAMLHRAAGTLTLNTQRNQPYSASDGVTHTLVEHAIPLGLLNVMLEVRNDLLSTSQAVDEVAGPLAELILQAIAMCGSDENSTVETLNLSTTLPDSNQK